MNGVLGDGKRANLAPPGSIAVHPHKLDSELAPSVQIES